MACIARPQAARRQLGGRLVVRHAGGQGADRAERMRVRAEMAARVGAIHPVGRPRAATPQHVNLRAGSPASHRHGDGGDHEAEQALAIHRRRSVGVPEGGQVRRQAANLPHLQIVKRPELRLAEALVFLR